MSSECCEVHCHWRDFHFLCIILFLENMLILYWISIFLLKKWHLVAPSSGKSDFWNWIKTSIRVAAVGLWLYWFFMIYLGFLNLQLWRSGAVLLLLCRAVIMIFEWEKTVGFQFFFVYSDFTSKLYNTRCLQQLQLLLRAALQRLWLALCWSAEPVWIHWAAVLLVHAFRPRLSPEQLTAPAGHNASVDLGPELVTCSVYFYCDKVKDGQQKFCAV